MLPRNNADVTHVTHCGKIQNKVAYQAEDRPADICLKLTCTWWRWKIKVFNFSFFWRQVKRIWENLDLIDIDHTKNHFFFFFTLDLDPRHVTLDPRPLTKIYTRLQVVFYVDFFQLICRQFFSIKIYGGQMRYYPFALAGNVPCQSLIIGGTVFLSDRSIIAVRVININILHVKMA